MKDAYFFILAQASPSTPDRTYRNQDAMHLRLAVLHLHDAALVLKTHSLVAVALDVPMEQSDYTRTERHLQHRMPVADANTYQQNRLDCVVRKLQSY